MGRRRRQRGGGRLGGGQKCKGERVKRWGMGWQRLGRGRGKDEGRRRGKRRGGFYRWMRWNAWVDIGSRVN